MAKFKSNWLRGLMQWGVLAAIAVSSLHLYGNKTFDPETYCPFGGLQTLATFLTRGSMACSMTMLQVMMGTVLAIGVILFGRLFCSYLCPLGLVNELFFSIRRKFRIRAFYIPKGSLTDRLLRSVKYILLFTIFYMTLSSSELFCKNFDPYYAIATGFKGEITAWMTLISVTLLFLGSLLVDMFWCKYICPLGALSNIFKFTVMFVGLLLLYWILFMLGLEIPWQALLACAAILGYMLEIWKGRAQYNLSMLHIHKDIHKCNGCGACVDRCPYGIDVRSVKRVTDIDCTLCGECVTACDRDAVKIGICNTRPGQHRIKGQWIPPLVTAVLFIIALYLGNTMELPTVDLRWNPESIAQEQLREMEFTGMKSVKCYGSSMAFKAQVSQVRGVYGVKTFVKTGRVLVYYDPAQTNEEAIREAVFTPKMFRIMTPGKDVSRIKVITVRAEGLHDKMDLNYLGLQFRNLKKQYYGIESEYACPVILRLYMGVDEPINEKDIEETLDKKELVMPLHGGGQKVIPCHSEFVELEEGADTIDVRPYLEKMLYKFNADFTARKNLSGMEMDSLDIVRQAFEKPIFTRNLAYISNHASQLEGLAAVKFVLNEANIPAVRFVYAKSLLTEDRLWDHLEKETWKIVYGKDDIRECPAKWKFKRPQAE